MNSLIAFFAIPIVTALVCTSFLGRPTSGRRAFVAISAAVQFGWALYITWTVSGGQPLVLLVGDWAPPFGILLVVDGLAGIMLCLSTIVSLATVLFGYAEIAVWAEQPLRLPLMQLLVAGINLTFMTGDLFNLFVAFELMLVASYALLTLEANDRDVKLAFPYLTVNIFGSALFLVAAGLAYVVFGTLNLAHISMRAAEMPGEPAVLVVVLLLMVVFGIKAGIFPLYYWLPNSYPILTFSLGAFYSGMLTKVGIYVLLRMLGTIFPHTLGTVHLGLAWLAGITLVLAVFGALSRNFIRGILSFHIVSQIGYMVLGIGLFTPAAITASIFYVIHHIIVKSSLFLIGGTAMFYNRTDNLARMGGLWKATPWLGVCFLCQALSLAGIPPLSGFWGKYAIVLAGMEQGRYWLVFAALLGSVLTLLSMLKIWLASFWRPLPRDGVSTAAVPGQALAMTAIIVVMTLISLSIGFGAEFFWRISEAASRSILDPTLYQKAVFSLSGKGAL